MKLLRDRSKIDENPCFLHNLAHFGAVNVGFMFSRPKLYGKSISGRKSQTLQLQEPGELDLLDMEYRAAHLLL